MGHYCVPLQEAGYMFKKQLKSAHKMQGPISHISVICMVKTTDENHINI